LNETWHPLTTETTLDNAEGKITHNPFHRVRPCRLHRKAGIAGTSRKGVRRLLNHGTGDWTFLLLPLLKPDSSLLF
jgi:hypothetical protein